MALVDVRGYNLDPNIMGNVQQGLQFGQQLGAQDRAAQIRGLLAQQGQQQPQTQQQQMLAEQTEGLGGQQALSEQPQVLSQDELIAQARRIDPEQAEKILTSMGLDDASKRAEMSRFAAKLQTIPFAQRPDAINARAQELQAQGRDPSETLKLLDVDEKTQNQALTGVQLMDLSTKERFAVQSKQAAYQQKRMAAAEVKSSKILDDGTVVQVMKAGETRVIGPDGSEITGNARSEAIRNAQEFGVDVQQRRAKGRETGKGAGKIAITSFETVGRIRENISDLQRGIDLIEKEGAQTGYVSDFLPNMKAATRKFANLRRKLGLNVVASVTFGALSEGELNLAMDVALPKGISPEKTVGWLKERIDAQAKLAENLEDASLYLADHSVAELIQRNRAMKKAAKKKEEAKEAETTTPQTTIKFMGFE